jgi:transposase, IS5 family
MPDTEATTPPTPTASASTPKARSVAFLPPSKKQMKRRAAIEPVIGHVKNEHRMNRNYLAHTQGDRINAILAAAGYNFRLLLNWLRDLLCLLLTAIFTKQKLQSA